jgi:Transposase DDE domain group 1
VRGDGHYGRPEVMDLCGEPRLFLHLWPARQQRAEGAPPPVVRGRGHALSGKEKVGRFFQIRYGAKSWSRERKVIVRVVATEQGSDTRFIPDNSVRLDENRNAW